MLCVLPPLFAAEQPTELDEDRAPKTKTGGNCFIRNATILTLTNGTIVDGSILVRDGKIVAVGKDLTPPDGVKVIDATGKFVMPGVIDCHSHIASDGGLNEGSVSISAEVRVKDTLNSRSVSMFRALAGGVTTAHVLHGSANAIGGQDATIKLKYNRPVEELIFPGAPQGIKFALGENPKRSNFQSQTGTQRFPATRMGVEATIRRAFTEAKDYMAEWDDYNKRKASDPNALPPRRDLRLETLAGILRGEILVHSHCYRADEILMLLRVADDFGFKVATLQHVLEGYKVAPEIAKHGAGGSTFSDWWAYKMEAYDAIPHNAALMREAGVVVSLNSDSAELMRRLYLEAAKAVKYGGVSETEALKMVTLNPAKQLGIAHRVGSVEVGKDADLAIFDGHPLSVYAKCVMTLIDGEVFFERRDAFGLDALKPLAESERPEGRRQKAEGRNGANGNNQILNLKSQISNVVAITGATIYPVTSAPIPNGTVVIRDGKIEALGADVKAPRGATVIRANGLRVYPGMIDSGTTLGLTEVSSVNATQDSSEIGNVQPDMMAATAVHPASEHIPVARVNGITTALVRPSGGLIAGQSALIHLDGWTIEEMAVNKVVALHVNYPGGFRFGGGGDPAACCEDEELTGGAPRPGAPGAGGTPPPSSDARLKEIRDFFGQAREYARVKDEAKKRGIAPPPVNPRLEAMIPYVRGEKPVIIHASSKREVVGAVKLGEELKVKFIIADAGEAWKVADMLAEKKIPVLIGPVLTTPSQSYDPYDAAFANAALLHKAGVPFAIQTNASSNVRNLPYNAGMAAAFGLPPDEALKAVTIYPAQILGVADRIGSLEVGKVADLVVTDGDLLEIVTQVRHLIINGKPVSLETKHTRLYQQYRQRINRAAAPSK
jgi:imidazolonepropionase-like amidohydrolase